MRLSCASCATFMFIVCAVLLAALVVPASAKNGPPTRPPSPPPTPTLECGVDCVNGCGGCINKKVSEQLRKEFSGKTVVLMGDSTNRVLMASLYNILDPTVEPILPKEYITNDVKAIGKEKDGVQRLLSAVNKKGVMDVFNLRSNHFGLSDFRFYVNATKTTLYFFWAGTPGYFGERSRLVPFFTEDKASEFTHLILNTGLWTLQGLGDVFSKKLQFPLEIENYEPKGWSKNLTEGIQKLCDTVGCRRAGAGAAEGGARLFWREAGYLNKYKHGRAPTFTDKNLRDMNARILQPRVDLKTKSNKTQTCTNNAIQMRLQQHVLPPTAKEHATNPKAPRGYDVVYLPAHEYTAQPCCKYYDNVHFGLLCGMQLWHIWCQQGLCGQQ